MDASTSMPWVSNPVALRILSYLQVAYPIVLLLSYFVTLAAYGIATARNDTEAASTQPEQLGPGGKPLPKKNLVQKKEQKRSRLEFSRSRKLLFAWLSVAVVGSLGANIVSVIVHALVERDERWWCGEAATIYLTGAFMVYILLLVHVVDASPTVAHWVTWLIASVMEIVLLGASFAVYTTEHRKRKIGHPNGGELEGEMTNWEIVEVSFDILRIVLLALLAAYYSFLVFLLPTKPKKNHNPDDERTGLLSDHGTQNGQATVPQGYGTQPNGNMNGHAHGSGRAQPHHGSGEVPAGWEKPKETPNRSWWEYIRAYAIFLPYIWPYKDRRLQLSFIVCFVIVFLQRGVNILVPIQAGRITDILAGEYGPVYMPWAQIALYVVYRIFQGQLGLLNAVRQVLWIPIEQYSYRELSVAAFEHVHNLSLEFHLGKKTGEVLSALGKGSSLNSFLESLTFNVLPMLVDLTVAMVYFLIRFDAYYALVIIVVSFWYVYITVRMASWRVDLRRAQTNASREEDAVKNDSMIGYEAVKYFNAEAYEFNRYRTAVEKLQTAEYKVTFTLQLLNTVQNLVFMSGLIVVCFIAAYQVTLSSLRVGDFVTLLTYMTQLQSPLQFFGTFYRMIQSNMINSERMLELFKEQPTVVDSPDAVPLASCEGLIRYNEVQFSYDQRKPALRGLDFTCRPGTATALVGESGGGKSTVFRLLFRFYNSEAGTIQVDGHDVESITIDSLRKHIGVVPQDTVLFNETLMYNLRYARQSATDEEIYEACRAASIHDKIMSFPDKYETKVGERGLRLSGGEKQRVAIARTIIKDPRIILLDEATAALDTETEEHIQGAFKTLAKGRTMLIIAHRLSTITMCDQICVLHEGRVAERGTHAELLAKKGKYANMWRKQIRAQRAAEEAKLLTDKAARLRRESMDSSGARNRTADMGDDSPISSDEDEAHRQQQRRVAALSPKLTGQSVPLSSPLEAVVEENAGKPPGHP